MFNHSKDNSVCVLPAHQRGGVSFADMSNLPSSSQNTVGGSVPSSQLPTPPQFGAISTSIQIVWYI